MSDEAKYTGEERMDAAQTIFDERPSLNNLQCALTRCRAELAQVNADYLSLKADFMAQFEMDDQEFENLKRLREERDARSKAAQP